MNAVSVRDVLSASLQLAAPPSCNRLKDEPHEGLRVTAALNRSTILVLQKVNAIASQFQILAGSSGVWLGLSASLVQSPARV